MGAGNAGHRSRLDQTSKRRGFCDTCSSSGQSSFLVDLEAVLFWAKWRETVLAPLVGLIRGEAQFLFGKVAGGLQAGGTC